MSRSLCLVTALIPLLLMLSSCAKRVDGPASNIGYDALRETLAGRDLGPLSGRRIMLDPGHGGVFPGVVGRDGFSEANANLGVALYLRGLLEAAGAEVFMTRTSDRDFLTPADSSLAGDLKTRSALIDSLHPDVFLSLHHNSNAALDRDLNETQTYYPVGRDGADLDLARAVHKHLVRNLEIRPAKILAGNFSVLRNTPHDVPSVLGEPSMLSNPRVEARLKTAEKLELEAQAYFLGLLEFFDGGLPRWQADPANAMWRTLGATWHFIPGDRGPRLDPSSLELQIDGALSDLNLNAGATSITWTPTAPISNAPRLVELRGRNIAGRTTPMFRDTLPDRSVLHEVRIVSVEETDTGSPERSRLIRWSHHDATGAPSPLPGTAWIGRQGGSRAEGFVLSTDVHHSGHMLVPFSLSFGQPFVTTQGLDGVLVSQEAQSTDLSLRPGQRWIVLDDDQPPGDRRPWTPRLHSGFATAPSALDPALVDRRLPYVPVKPTDTIWLELEGYRPLVRTSKEAWRDTLAWQPVFAALAGKTIVIDPAGGGSDHQGLAPMGTPGRELNLRTAERLAALLRGAGARVFLTRKDPGWVPQEHKVLLANRERAHLFLTISRHSAPDSIQLTHHIGSRNGERWAELTSAAWREAGVSAIAARPSYAYLLRHTAPPALNCAMPMPETEDDEDLARSPARQQAEAFVLLRAIAAYFSEPGGTSLPPGWNPSLFMERHRTSVPRPDDVDWIRVDGNWLWLPPGSTGPNPILPASSGARTIEIRVGDQWWLLEANPGADTLIPRLYGIGDRALERSESEPPELEVLHAPAPRR